MPRSTLSILLLLKCPFFHEIKVRRDSDDSDGIIHRSLSVV